MKPNDFMKLMAGAKMYDLTQPLSIHTPPWPSYMPLGLQYFKRNQQIHSALISLSGNESLALVHDILQSRMKRIRFIGDQQSESWAAAVDEHEEMIAALEARDGARLSSAMADHLAQSWERIHSEI